MFWHVSVCPHLGGGGYPSQVQIGGYASQVQWGVPPHRTWLGGTPPQVPPSDLAEGYPYQGGTPHQTWVGGTPAGGYPISGTPLSDLAGDTLGGGGVLHLGYPPIGPGWGGTPPSDLGRGVPLYPPSPRNRWSTWYAALGMPLAFTQEDFRILIHFRNWDYAKPLW